MYTIQEVYEYLNSGAVAPTPGPFREPGAAPGSTMKTLAELYADIKAKLDQCSATAADVEEGKKFFCTQPGSWGVQTGTRVLPTPTPTPTPTWYEKYGPSGTDQVVKIGNLYVTKWNGTPGYNGGYQSAMLTWASGLDWLEKSSGWRIPNKAEWATICEGKEMLGYIGNHHHSSEKDQHGSPAIVILESPCTTWGYNNAWYSARVIRNAD